MNNFLKKLIPQKEAILNKAIIMEDMPKSISKALYPKEVVEIHHEFETAADKLLEEAKSIITEASTKNVDKANRLELLGFKQANQVTELKPLIQKAALSKEQIELINYYKREYPFNKFIDEERVKTICHKYNLVCGDVSRFKGFVPEKNLRDIEKFKLKKNEIDNLPVAVLIDVDKKVILTNVTKAEIFNDYWGILNGASATFTRGNNTSKSFSKRVNDLTNNGSAYFCVDGGKVDNKLKICAPVKDMDISGLELVEGYKLEKKHIPDPVVLQPVKGGYLILTAWGDEASDPLVINEINN